MVGEEITGLIDGEGPKLADEHHQPRDSATFWAGRALLIGLNGGTVSDRRNCAQAPDSPAVILLALGIHVGT